MRKFVSDEQRIEALIRRLIDVMIESGKFSTVECDSLMHDTTCPDISALRGTFLYMCETRRVTLPRGIWQELYKEAERWGENEDIETLNDISEYSFHSNTRGQQRMPETTPATDLQKDQHPVQHPSQQPAPPAEQQAQQQAEQQAQQQAEQPGTQQIGVHPAAHVIAVPPFGEPQLAEDAWVGPGAIVVGNVRIGSRSSIWYNAVVRGDSDSVEIGEGSNVQDLAAIHTQKGCPVRIGDGVSLGHGAVVHGAVIENNCLIGMNATVLSGAVVGEGSLVAAGAVVKEGMQVPPRSLVAGVPARVVRELDDAGYEAVVSNAARYLGYTLQHAAATGCLPGTGE